MPPFLATPNVLLWCPWRPRGLPGLYSSSPQSWKMRSCCCSPAALVQLSGPLSSGQRAKPSGLYVAYCLRLAGLRGTNPQHTQGAPPSKKGEEVSWRHLVFPCPLPFTACPSLAPYLAIPLVAPSPSLHGLGAPWLILSPALGSMNGLGAPQWCEGDQIRQGGRPGPPPLPPAAATDPVHQRTIKRRAPRPAPSACRPSRAEPDPRTVSQRPPSPPEPVAPQPAAPPLFFFF